MRLRTYDVAADMPRYHHHVAAGLCGATTFHAVCVYFRYADTARARRYAALIRHADVATPCRGAAPMLF